MRSVQTIHLPPPLSMSPHHSLSSSLLLPLLTPQLCCDHTHIWWLALAPLSFSVLFSFLFHLFPFLFFLVYFQFLFFFSWFLSFNLTVALEMERFCDFHSLFSLFSSKVSLDFHLRHRGGGGWPKTSLNICFLSLPSVSPPPWLCGQRNRKIWWLALSSKASSDFHLSHRGGGRTKPRFNRAPALNSIRAHTVAVCK